MENYLIFHPSTRLLYNGAKSNVREMRAEEVKALSSRKLQYSSKDSLPPTLNIEFVVD